MHEKQLYGRGPGGFHRVAYAEWGQASAQPPVICVHGLTRNGRDFDYLAHALEGDGRQVFCPDIVGRGKSDWLANAVDYNYAQYLTDILLHGLHSDVLSTPIAEEMTQRGPCAQLVEFPKIGHAPALMEPTQIATIAEFLRP